MNNALLALLAIPFLLPTVAASPPAVEIKNDAYLPATLTITAGQTVTFNNEDDDAHTVTATNGSFDSKGLDSGALWRHKFEKPGTYRYFCELHSFMKGSIIVKAVML